MHALVLAAAATAAPAPVFDYDRSAPLAVTVRRVSHREGLTVEDVTFPSPNGGTIRGRLVLPANRTHRAGVLFVHWLGDPKTTNLSEFSDDAAAVARRGAVALSIDAMWAQKEWYEKLRTPQRDYANSVAQVIDLRRSLDVLLAQPGVDTDRIAYVGHDFGAMYGAIVAGVDERVRWFVLMAGNPSFAKWYTYDSKPADPATFAAQMEALAPAHFLAQSKARGFLFQFADHDVYVSADEAAAFAAGAPPPRGTFVYRAKHDLRVPEAFADRQAWLDAKLRSAP